MAKDEHVQCANVSSEPTIYFPVLFEGWAGLDVLAALSAKTPVESFEAASIFEFCYLYRQKEPICVLFAIFVGPLTGAGGFIEYNTLTLNESVAA